MEALCIHLDSREPDGPQVLQPTVTARQLQCAQNMTIERQKFWWLLMSKSLYGVQIVGLSIYVQRKISNPENAMRFSATTWNDVALRKAHTVSIYPSWDFTGPNYNRSRRLESPWYRTKAARFYVINWQ